LFIIGDLSVETIRDVVYFSSKKKVCGSFAVSRVRLLERIGPAVKRDDKEMA
jgi:hypothetical protein